MCKPGPGRRLARSRGRGARRGRRRGRARATAGRAPGPGWPGAAAPAASCSCTPGRPPGARPGAGTPARRAGPRCDNARAAGGCPATAIPALHAWRPVGRRCAAERQCAATAGPCGVTPPLRPPCATLCRSTASRNRMHSEAARPVKADGGKYQSGTCALCGQRAGAARAGLP